MIQKIPSQIIEVLQTIEKAGFEAYIVGGCVRFLVMKDSNLSEPNDWDITTNAQPKELLKKFPNSFYENKFGTVGVKVIPFLKKGLAEREYDIIEVTTYRIESTYSDKRHPDQIKFAQTLTEDLSRRDFTINALALQIIPSAEAKASYDYTLIDLFDGQKDLAKRLIRAVGNPDERFNEDALRMLRAIRFSVQLNFKIEEKTLTAIKKHKDLLKYVSAERIRDELEKIIISNRPAEGIKLLVETGLMENIIPEISTTIDVTQNRHHYYGPFNTVYKHLLAALKTCPSEKLEVRLAAFLHDIGKPKAKRGKGEFATFYGHEYIGAKITKTIMERLKFPKKITDKTVLLVKNHMFYYNVEEVGEKGVRKVITKVGLDNINDLIDVRIGDRLGSGVAKAIPYKLRHFKYMVEKVSKDPLSVKQLKINGNDLIKELAIKPGPIIGNILDVLLAEVIDEPKLNSKEKLLKRVEELQDKNNLEDLDEVAKKKIKEKKKEDDKKTKGKYWVK